MSKDAATLVSTRKSTHGDWSSQAGLAAHLKNAIRSAIEARLDAFPVGEAYHVSPQQQEAIEMILIKVSRIVTGNPNEPDHWNDIQGYAELGKNDGHKK